jgi:hypothetical protein
VAVNAPAIPLRCAECGETQCTPIDTCEHGAPACVACEDCAHEAAENEWLATASEKERLGEGNY